MASEKQYTERTYALDNDCVKHLDRCNTETWSLHLAFHLVCMLCEVRERFFLKWRKYGNCARLHPITVKLVIRVKITRSRETHSTIR